MRFSTWTWRLLPFWTFVLGLLIGGLPGGVTRARNLGALALYVVVTGVVWLPLELYARRLQMTPSDG